MDSGRHERISAIFLDACELEGSSRAAFLDEACDGDDEMRAEIESLLEADEGDAAVDEPIDLENMPSLAESDDAPDRIGRYDILGTIGRGGMGIVYRARQANPDRLVALKVLRPGSVSEALIRRFKHEAQVLGRLQHPGIAQIFEAGASGDGRYTQPYFAMELVEGEPLLDDAEHRKLGTRDRLELVALICDAVHHAHQKGVIHRDLKPGNILVDAAGQPKVLDFGVARATDADIRTTTVQTDVGQLVGTVPYMSPEQVAGDPNEIDIRSDVYALGVVTFELLTGRLPYDVKQSPIPEAARMIRDDEPSRLSSIDRALRGDIETIVGKSLEKDRDRRYQSAAELGADIRRYLADEPIVARPASTLYQLGKFARRNRALVSSVAIVLIVLVVALIVSTSFAIRASTAENVAIDERDDAAAEAARSRAINEFLRRMLGAANPYGRAGYEGREVTVVDVLDQGSEWIAETFTEEERAVEAEARLVIGNTYSSLGRYVEAEEHTRAALSLQREAYPAGHIRIAEALREHGIALVYLGRFDEGIDEISDALAIVEADPSAPATTVRTTIGELGWALRISGRVDEAEPVLRRAIEIYETTAGRDDPDYAAAINNLAGVLRSTGRNDGSRELYERAREIYVAAFGELNGNVGTVDNNIGASYLTEGRFAEAEPYFAKAIAAMRTVLGDEHPRLADMLYNHCYALHELGELEEAATAATECVEIYRSAVGVDHPDYALAIHGIALIEIDLGKLERAREHFEWLIGFWRRQDGPDSTRAAGHTIKLADVRADLGEADGDDIERLLAVGPIIEAEMTSYFSWYLEVLARVYRMNGFEQEAAATEARLASIEADTG